MQYIFCYSITVAAVTPDGNLTRMRFRSGTRIIAATRNYNYVDGQRVLNLELTDGYVLVNVPEHAVHLEDMAVRV